MALRFLFCLLTICPTVFRFVDCAKSRSPCEYDSQSSVPTIDCIFEHTGNLRLAESLRDALSREGKQDAINADSIKIININALVLHIPNGAFRSFPNVEKLVLKSTKSAKGSVAEQDAFKDMPHLKSVLLDGFDLIKANAACLGALHNNVNHLNLYKCSIDDRPRIFQHFNNLTHVAIVECDITELSHDAFQRSGSKLKVLHISKTRLHAIKKAYFVDLSALEKLELAENEIATIEQGSFDSFQNLRMVDLQNNALKTWPENLFKHSPKMCTLLLDGNQSVKVSKSGFVKCAASIAQSSLVIYFILGMLAVMRWQ